MKFQITQHIRDYELIKSLVTYFDCGRVTVPSGYAHCNFVVEKFADISEKIIPFFIKHPFNGAKAKDFTDFNKAAELMKNKEHLTEDGLVEIRKLKAGMNRGRVN